MHHRVGTVGDLNEGEMKQVKAGETPVLLVRIDGSYRAFNAHCPHYGAPLAEGLLADGRITCPWHHACFDARTGDLLEPPALDALASYDVRVDGEEIVVDLPESPADRRALPATRVEIGATEEVIAIVGGGAAAYMAAQTIRECGDARRIVMITPEDRLPYDRPNLSKDYLNGHADPAWMPLRPDDYFERNGVEVIRGVAARRFDAARRAIELTDGRTIAFSEALIASGCIPRALDVPGAELDGVHVLRSFDDAEAIIASAGEGRRAVVIGASFIAMEAAASLATRGSSVTVVAPDAVPFERVLGSEIGGLLRSTQERKGVAFCLGATVERLDGDGRVSHVVLASGERLACDLVVVGIGVSPATGFVEGLEVDERGGIVVDDRLRAGDGVYAAGDVASYPDPRGGGRIRIEHWRTALQLGRVAGGNIAGRDRRFDGVPFFWTQQFDANLHYVGHARSWDEIVLRGELAAGDFIAYYVKDGRVHAAATMGRDRDAIVIAEAIRRTGYPTLEELPR